MEEVLGGFQAALAGGVKTAFGSYTGDSTSGSSARTKLAFDFEPKALLLWSRSASYRAISIRSQNMVV